MFTVDTSTLFFLNGFPLSGLFHAVLAPAGGAFWPSSFAPIFRNAALALATTTLPLPIAVAREFGPANFLPAFQPTLMHLTSHDGGDPFIEVITLRKCSDTDVWGFPISTRCCPQCGSTTAPPLRWDRLTGELNAPINLVTEVKLKCKTHSPPIKGPWVARPKEVVPVPGTVDLVWHVEGVVPPRWWG